MGYLKGAVMKRLMALGLPLLVWIAAAPLYAGVINIDGNLSDWGIDPAIKHWLPGIDAVNTGAIGAPLTGSIGYNGALFHYWVEDGVSQHNGYNGYVEPGYGGQAYDVEAMYFTEDADNYYLSIVTGYNFNNNTYKPGDIAIDTDGNGSYDYGFVIKDRNGFSGGAFYNAADWTNVLYIEHYAANPFQMASASQLYANLPYYAGASEFSGHYLLELALDKDLFGNIIGDGTVIHWTMECGNDYANLEVVPEPATFALFLSLFGALVPFRRKR